MSQVYSSLRIAPPPQFNVACWYAGGELDRLAQLEDIGS